MTIWNSVPTGMYVAIGAAALLLLGIAVFTVAVVRALHRASMPAPQAGPPRPTAPGEESRRDMHKAGATEPGNSAADTAAAPSPREAMAQPGRRRTILIAEDDPVISLSLSLRLKRLGFDVWCSPDALHALMGSERLNPDAAILDVAMPGGDGLAVCEMLASDPARAQMPRIVHTSHADQQTKLRCRELGAHYVEKSSRSWQQIRAILERYFGPLEERVPAETAPSLQDHASSANAKPDRTAPPSFSPVNASVCGRARLVCVSPADRLAPVERQLANLGALPISVNNLDNAFWTCVSDKPHLVVLDGTVRPADLQALITRFREHPVTRELPLAVVGRNDGVTADMMRSGYVLVLPPQPSDEDLLRELRVWIPLGASEMPIPKPGHAVESPEEQYPTILCIDDDQEISYALSTRLEPYGIHVRAAISGSDGIHDALGHTPDLILLDLKMPDAEGNYVLSRLKSHPLLENIPVVFLTAESSRAVARQMVSLGAVGFLSKPVRWEDLFTEIGRHVELPEQLIRDYNLRDEQLLATH